MIRLALVRLVEKVSMDCTIGAGLAFTHKGWELYRTRHLDKLRDGTKRDDGYNCDKFKKIVTLFLKHKKITIRDGHYNLMYKEDGYFQEIVITVDNERKSITVITIIALSLERQSDYRNPKHERRIFIGKL